MICKQHIKRCNYNCRDDEFMIEINVTALPEKKDQGT